jgi:aspartyl-tRNA(Asn)/glutamyl-tRNA(Gln) amidotransferase subunit A
MASSCGRFGFGGIVTMYMTKISNENGRFGSAPARESLLSTANEQDIHCLSIAEMQIAFARGSIKPTTMISHILARIALQNPVLKAFVEIDHAGVARAAEVSEANFASDTQRPLEGIPVAVTADFAVKGLGHHAGMAACDDIIAVEDCDAVLKLRNAGAIIIGTLNMDEAGLGVEGANPFCGQSANPHDTSRSCGGAAGGAASAVAAGLCVAALGVDGFGAIRVPASFCGTFGYLPTPHQIPAAGIWPFTPQFDSVAIVARSMDDLSFLANVMFTPDLATAMRRSRFLRLAANGGVDCTTDVSLAFVNTVTELRETPSELILTHSCAEIALSLRALRGRSLAAQLSEMGEERCLRLSAQFEEQLGSVLDQSDEALAAHQALLDLTTSELRQQIASNGVLIMPTTSAVAPHIGAPESQDVIDFVALANVAGLPAVTIPVGRSNEGMPIGVTLIGPVGGDAMVIAQSRMLNDARRGYFAPNPG